MKPRLAFVSLWDATQPNAESGYAYSMRRQLLKRFDVVDLFPLVLPGETFWLPVRAMYKLGGRYYHPMREPSVLKRLARGVERALKAVRPDIAFAPSSVPLSFAETRCPWAFATDQPFHDLVERYIPNPSARFRQLGNAQENRALASAALAAYPSAWAAQSAIQNHGADASRVAVIPWGANLPHEISDSNVNFSIARRRFDRCDLVFIGRDWLRKGGETLAATVAELNQRGIPTRATIIGCRPPGLPDAHFTSYPFIDKQSPDQFGTFSSVMLNAHFLFLPSHAEAYGQAFCEAMAFGVPVIGSTAGGIPTIVRDGETGFLRPAETAAAEFADLIGNTLSDPSRYLRMAHEARRDYRERLNWDKFGQQLGDTLAALA